MKDTPEMAFIKEVDRALEDKIESKRQQIEVLKRALEKAERELSELWQTQCPF